MRHLATIQKVESVSSIEGADMIELAHVLGWQCVTKKHEFKEGDLCVYFEIDSFLPEAPIFEFLRSSSFKNSEFMGRGFRLKTQRFRGEISQGLILPVYDVLQSFKNEETLALITELKHNSDSVIGKDVTEMLGVKLFEIPETATTGGTVIAEISSIGVPHPDETRIQAEPKLLEAFSGLSYYITTKMDGSSHSVAIDEDGIFHVTGHNYEYKDDDKSDMYRLVKKINLETRIREYMKENGLKKITLQGEFCAPGIQNNKLKLKEPHWYVFTVIENGMRVGLNELKNICEALKLEMVPLEETGEDLPGVYPSIDALLDRAGENRCHAYPGTPEGIVIRPTEPVFCPLISSSLSMKVINNRYLLKAKD